MLFGITDRTLECKCLGYYSLIKHLMVWVNLHSYESSD